MNSAQRIRIGLIGLAGVFLLVLLGTAISRSGDDGNGVVAVNSGEPNEPLAELGVAPGQSDADNLVNAQGNVAR